MTRSIHDTIWTANGQPLPATEQQVTCSSGPATIQARIHCSHATPEGDPVGLPWTTVALLPDLTWDAAMDSFRYPGMPLQRDGVTPRIVIYDVTLAEVDPEVRAVAVACSQMAQQRWFAATRAQILMPHDQTQADQANRSARQLSQRMALLMGSDTYHRLRQEHGHWSSVCAPRHFGLSYDSRWVRATV